MSKLQPLSLAISLVVFAAISLPPTARAQTYSFSGYELVTGYTIINGTGQSQDLPTITGPAEFTLTVQNQNEATINIGGYQFTGYGQITYPDPTDPSTLSGYLTYSNYPGASYSGNFDITPTFVLAGFSVISELNSPYEGYGAEFQFINFQLNSYVPEPSSFALAVSGAIGASLFAVGRHFFRIRRRAA